MTHPSAPMKPSADEVARPARDALTSLEAMFRRSAAVAHDLLDHYDCDPERRHHEHE